MVHSHGESVNLTAQEMMEWIQEIVDFGIRRPGWDGQRATEKYLVQRFRDFGLEQIAEEPVPVHRWQPERTELHLSVGERSIACAAIPYTAWTGKEGLQSELVWIDNGTPEDFEGKDLRGKIAVMNARFRDFETGALKQAAFAIHDPENTIPDGVLHKANWLITNFPAYYAAQKRGAAGFIGLLVDSPIDDCGHWVPYDGWLKDRPGIWVGKSDAETVQRAARCGEAARLVTTGTTERVDSHNVVGWVPDQSEETILLTCHHDAPWASAVEDASGLSILLGLAKHFGQRQLRLKRNLLFVGASGHFHGGTGNRVFVEKHRRDWLKNTVAALGVEHIANEAEPDGTGGYRLTGRPEVRAIFTENCPALVQTLETGIKNHNLDRTLVIPPYLFGPEPPCDAAPYFTAGIASACLISGPLYLFDRFDTVDKVRSQDLLPVLNFIIETIEIIDDLPASELRKGLAHTPDDPPPPLPHWFAPPEQFLDSA